MIEPAESCTAFGETVEGACCVELVVAGHIMSTDECPPCYSWLLNAVEQLAGRPFLLHVPGETPF